MGGVETLACGDPLAWKPRKAGTPSLARTRSSLVNGSSYKLPWVWALLAALPVVAQIDVEGVTDRQVIGGPASFRITTEPGYNYVANLDGAPAPLGEWVVVQLFGYHELAVSRTQTESGHMENRLIRFVMLSPDRDSAEYGLFPWTPHIPMDSAPLEFTGAGLRLIVPREFPWGLRVPVIALTRNEEGRAAGLNGPVWLSGVPERNVRIKRGFGFSFLSENLSAGPLTIRGTIQSLSEERVVEIDESTAWQVAPGNIGHNETWVENCRVHVTSNLTIEAGASLTIAAGTVVKLDAGVDITVHGKLLVTGTPSQPVVLLPSRPDAPWGGFFFWEGPAEAEIANAIFTGSGANGAWFNSHPSFRSHRPEQALFYLGKGARATLTETYIIANAGQAFHGEEGFLTLDKCLVQGCQTAGQFNGGSVQIHQSALLDFPSDDLVYVNGDNDALYFTLGTHRLTDTLVGWTKDDGIDAGAAEPGEVVVERCWFEACFHEGMALSGTEKIVKVSDSVFLDNGQGIESGYYSPLVTVEDSLLLANEVGARFGDNYSSTHTGSLRVTNSFLLYNHRDVWGFVPELWVEDLGRMDIQGNYLTRTDPQHPANIAWELNPAGEELTRFRATWPGAVGAGFPQAQSTNRGATSVHEIEVRLSSFSPVPVAVDYAVAGGSALAGVDFQLEQGTLRFTPGQISQALRVLVFDNPPRLFSETVEIALTNPVSAEFGSNQSRHRLTLLAPATDLTLVPNGDRWRFCLGRQEASDPRPAWRGLDFSDAEWESGDGPFGYGAEVCRTDMIDMFARCTSFFLRREFELQVPEAIDILNLSGVHSDGFIVWMNGEELARVGVPDGDLPYSATSDVSTGEILTWDKTIARHDLPLLLPGKNVIAVQVFNDRSDSPILVFDVGLKTRVSGDQDGDRLPDVWEENIVNASVGDDVRVIEDVAPYGDFDGDGSSNRAELLAGTDPADSRSCFSLQAARSTGGCTLTIEARPGRRYVVERAEALATEVAWKPLADVVARPESRIVSIQDAGTETDVSRF